MVLMQLTVPDASFPGDQITVSAGGEEFLVTVPNGVGPGSLIEVDLPLASEQAAPEAQLNQRVQVTIPENCRAGEPFSVQAPWGGVFEVVVPEGLLPGDFLEVELPTEQVAQLAAEATAPAGEEPITPAVDGALEGADAYAGMHRIGAHVSVLRSNGSYSPGTIKEYDELSDTYTLELPVRSISESIAQGSPCRLMARPPSHTDRQPPLSPPCSGRSPQVSRQRRRDRAAQP